MTIRLTVGQTNHANELLTVTFGTPFINKHIGQGFAQRMTAAGYLCIRSGTPPVGMKILLPIASVRRWVTGRVVDFDLTRSVSTNAPIFGCAARSILRKRRANFSPGMMKCRGHFHCLPPVHGSRAVTEPWVRKKHRVRWSTSIRSIGGKTISTCVFRRRNSVSALRGWLRNNFPLRKFGTGQILRLATYLTTDLQWKKRRTDNSLVPTN
jgi:hypothetical protein